MNKEEFISSGLLELYAMGISSPEETNMVEDYLKNHPEVKRELDEIEKSLEDYAQANAMQPSSSVKEKIFNEIASQPLKDSVPVPVIPISRKEYRIPLFFKIAAALLFILLIESTVLIYSFYNKYHTALNDLTLAQQKIDQQEKSNMAMSTDLDVVTNKYAQPVVLNGTPKEPGAVAKIFWMKNTGQVYIDPSNLPEVPEGKQYQLWAIVDGKPIDGGMIATKKGIYHIQKMKSFGKVDAFAITLEKSGGSPTPTMDEMIVSAKM
ncbi:MAG: anti-sigma factor [Bacteroidota bacterium]|nr:anti-sigma factor [Bacteroidota bacterium]